MAAGQVGHRVAGGTLAPVEGVLHYAATDMIIPELIYLVALAFSGFSPGEFKLRSHVAVYRKHNQPNNKPYPILILIIYFQK